MCKQEITSIAEVWLVVVVFWSVNIFLCFNYVTADDVRIALSIIRGGYDND